MPSIPSNKDVDESQPAVMQTKSAGNNASTASGAVNEIDTREHQLFRSLDFDNDRQVFHNDLLEALRQAGLRADDVRLRESMTALESYLRAAGGHHRSTLPVQWRKPPQKPCS